eukprot:Phypoly_transcript_12725.p1 GENE.Phypoly_transcript_12725~~Phypoly_transcript_12725.p1  ORF type:complete len:343 (+),score=61.19 Phypoly_transcript_12725:51-1079(+)
MQVLLKIFLVVALLGAVAVCEGDVTVLTEANFDALTASGEWLLEFYAPWCGHCKKLAPTYEELATKVKGQYNVGKVDCTVEKNLGTRFAIKGYPTIKFLKDGKIYDFAGAREVNSFVDFMAGGYAGAKSAPLPAKVAAAPPSPVHTDDDNTKSDVVELTDSNFHELTSKGTWFLEFYAPWCGHCKRLAPTYEQLATALKGVVNVGKVDCTVHRGVCAQYDVHGYPTLYYKRDKELYSYEGGRKLEDLKEFAETGWKSATPASVPEPLSGWQAKIQEAIGYLEGVSINIWLVVIVCVVVGVLLGVCVVAMSPSPSANKTIHYAPASSSATKSEITPEEVSKLD